MEEPCSIIYFPVGQKCKLKLGSSGFELMMKPVLLEPTSGENNMDNSNFSYYRRPHVSFSVEAKLNN